MDATENAGQRNYWFVGAAFGGNRDQTERFIREGVWDNDDPEQFRATVMQMRTGDPIAIKVRFRKKHDLPFDNHGNFVAGLSIKAVGVITENPQDGRSVRVDWQVCTPPRLWYFTTFFGTIWRVQPTSWEAQALIDFTFHNVPQAIDTFRNAPYWRERFGDTPFRADATPSAPASADAPSAAPAYTIASIIEDGAFVEESVLASMLERLKKKKNIILQGPPGTGKTWLGKRLAYALMGQKEPARILAVQFHPNMSYEDFIRGWRPSGDGRLSLQDGPFLRMRARALAAPDAAFMVIIEEINRGNPAQIFGEMLTLIESGKRTRDDALQLSYVKEGEERCWLPENLYIIGTMNIADRSLAMVDVALRRRFAFFTLLPSFNAAWEARMRHAGIDPAVSRRIRDKMLALNDAIAADPNLGAQCGVGHSYVTPRREDTVPDGRAWFRQVVETEIAPLLDEYAQNGTIDADALTAELLRDM